MKEDFIIEIVADYGGKTGSNDLAFSEVKNRVYKYFDKNEYLEYVMENWIFSKYRHL